MGTRAPRLSVIAVAVAFSLTCIGLILFVWLSFKGPIPLAPEGYRFQARFPAAAQLTSNNRVRISGIEVGRVVEVSQVGLRTQAVIELDHEYAPIPADTRAILRSKTLLGETFVELTPGTKTAPKLDDGGTLPESQIRDQQQVDEVLGAFDAPTRRAFKRFLGDLAAALEDRGPDINAALGQAGPAVEDLSDVVVILDRQRADVRRLVRDTGRTLAALGRREGDLQRLVTAGDEVLTATAGRNRELTETVRVLPGFLSELRATLAAVEGTSVDAAPVLRELRPVAPLVRPGLEEAIRLAPQVEGLFRDLGRLIPATRRGLPAVTRIARATRPLLRVLGPAGDELVPVLDLVGEYDKEIVTGLANLAAATQASIPRPGGGRQHYLRALIPILNEGIYGYERRLGSNRYNPYLAPGGLGGIGSGGLRAFDCRNTGNPQTIPVLGTGSPPRCLEQQPWTFRGATRSFPHVERADR